MINNFELKRMKATEGVVKHSQLSEGWSERYFFTSRHFIPG